MFWVGETGQASQPNPLTSGRGRSLLGGDLACTGWLVSSVPRHASIPWEQAGVPALPEAASMPDCGRDTLSALGQLLPAGQAHAPPSSSDGDPASAHSRGAGPRQRSPSALPLTFTWHANGSVPFAAAEGEWSRGPGGGNPQLQLAGRRHFSSGPESPCPSGCPELCGHLWVVITGLPPCAAPAASS